MPWCPLNSSAIQHLLFATLPNRREKGTSGVGNIRTKFTFYSNWSGTQRGQRVMPANTRLDGMVSGLFQHHLRSNDCFRYGGHNFPKTGLVDMSRHICLVENSKPRIRGVTK